jgi:hypothetical protein
MKRKKREKKEKKKKKEEKNVTFTSDVIMPYIRIIF